MGNNKEPEALNSFIQKTGLQVVETGVSLHECGILGAFPDGLVEDNVALWKLSAHTIREI